MGGGTNTRLDADDNTIVVPDVEVLCDRNKMTEQEYIGAPDMVVEVLSPSTRKKDKTVKLHKYMKAGVREYWIVDPEKQYVIVYMPSKEGEYDTEVYTFEDKVPVSIFGNECQVDFKEIREYING